MVDKGIPLRLVLYSVAIVYLAVDFFVIGGPLRRAIFRKSPTSKEAIAAAKQEGVVARVYYQPILLSQVDRRVEEDLWKSGREFAAVNPEERKLLRRAALNELIDLHLLRLKIRFNQEKAVVSAEEIAREMRIFRARFASDEEFQASLAAHGWSETELEYRLAARLQQERYLEHLINVEVGEEEARAWFEENREALALPERVRARHIFRAPANGDSESEQTILAQAQERIVAKEAAFEALAAALSEDPRTKGQGGDLGWMQAGRLPADFAGPLFAMEPGERKLFQTALGWHLVEMLEKRPRTLRSFEEAREEVLAALEAVKRDEGLRLYREQLRHRDRRKIEVFLDVLEGAESGDGKSGR
jgi:parvulin-like peptidyl-prolyl isomerase